MRYMLRLTPLESDMTNTTKRAVPSRSSLSPIYVTAGLLVTVLLLRTAGVLWLNGNSNRESSAARSRWKAAAVRPSRTGISEASICWCILATPIVRMCARPP